MGDDAEGFMGASPVQPSRTTFCGEDSGGIATTRHGSVVYDISKRGIVLTIAVLVLKEKPVSKQSRPERATAARQQQNAGQTAGNLQREKMPP